ncbi:MAG: MltA domain-containing protein [Desulfobulbaceae bacterium]|nr:MltA domain-containing protein [Desulfobulbaceae bacterium]
MKKSFPVSCSFFPLLCLLLVLLAGCTGKYLRQVPEDRLPDFTDDMHLASLQTAIAANLEYLRSQDPQREIILADRTYTVSGLIRSQEFFLQLLAGKPTAAELNQRIRENFEVYQAVGTSGVNLHRKMLVTGYFQPVFAGSLEKKEPFNYPLYSVPPDLVRRQMHQGQSITGRMDGKKLVPYWTREEIENQQKAAGSEIAWLQDPFDVFVLHVQGSGLIRLSNGSLRSLHYAARNGHPYRSIGKFMVDTGRIRLADAGLQTIRDYLADNPHEREKILHHNPSFIFFDWADTRGAVGNLGKELTAGRSVAVDQGCFPGGLLGFLFSRRPAAADGKNAQWQPLHRFVVVQDSGSAIRGPGRVDLYWGTGSEAGRQAGQMKEPGSLYFFILKDRKT